MADSEDKKKSVSPKTFADDLDSMLDDAASLIDSDELMNDDDAIDKLLMDSAFDEQELSDDEDEFEQLFADDSAAGDQINDELANDLNTDNELSEAESDIDQATVQVDFSEDSAMAEIDEFSDLGFDEFAETESEPEPEPSPVFSSPKEEEVEAVSETGFDSDDFTLAEFDISDQEDEFDEFTTTQDENIAFDEVEENPRAMEDSEEAEQEPDRTEQDFAVYNDDSALPEAMTADARHKEVVDDVITTQISQLFSEQEILKQQLATMSASTSQGQTDEIDRLSKAQSQLKKQLDNGGKIPTITYVAMAIAVVALLTAGVFAYLALQSDNEIESLTELIGTLEENQAELNALLIKNSMPEAAQTSPAPMALQDEPTEGDKIEVIPLTPVAPKLAETETNGAVSPEAQLAGAASMAEATPADKAKETEQAEGSPPLSDVPEDANQVAALEAKIKELEKKLAKATAPPVKKTVSKPSAPVRRSPPRAAAPSASWSVNLISFKQDWYANRKAAEFSRQGVPAKVIPVQVKGETWYRLSVSGFKSRDEASAYAARVKRTHNLDSVWIARD
ncbi:SPOR domain-containing protein [Methylotuvimicrobium buryatense]|uniref:SPOR domain-containing protein n=1 Tax=Methylotuvimicrobium buryatense TaxID=95641 RepID=A0A4V1IJM9_METBY|nr:SPOR domain-containing protein [Methylotuvimicrobium buryatense]QCW81965.1 SPOR domain-containing protein [Methylotuvimicrobium buryatense]